MKGLDNAGGTGLSLRRAAELLKTHGVDDFAEQVCATMLMLAGVELQRPGGPAATGPVEFEQRTTGEVSMSVFGINKTGRNAFRHVTIGRTGNHDVFVHDISISTFHAFVEIDDEGGLAILDAGSKNGTFVGGAAVPKRGEGEAVALKSGDSLRLGAVIFTVIDPVELHRYARMFVKSYKS